MEADVKNQIDYSTDPSAKNLTESDILKGKL